MPDNKPFKLGELSSFELEDTQSFGTSTGTGNDLKREFDNLFGDDSSDGSLDNIFGDNDNTIKIKEPEKRKNDKVSFEKSFRSAAIGLKATGHGALAAGATALGFDKFADSEIKASEKSQRKADRIAHGLIMDLNDIEFDKGIGEGLKDLNNYLINGLGTVTPSILETVTAGIAGAAVGSAVPVAGTIAGGIAGGAAKIVGKKKLQSLIKEYVATQGFKKTASQSAKKVALNLKKKKIVEDANKRFFSAAGALASGQVLGTGEIFNEALEAGASKEDAATFGLIGGVPFAALDTILPASIIKNIGKKFVGGRVKNAAREGAESFVKEGTTELAQEEILLRTKKNFDNDFDIAGEEATSRRLNSFVLGGFAGGLLGGVSGSLQRKIETKDLKTPLTNVDFSNKEVKTSYARLLSFIGTNERMVSLINSDRDQDTVNKTLNNSKANISDLKKDLTNKFLSEENTDIESKAEAKEVIKTIDAHLGSIDTATQESVELSKNDAKVNAVQEDAIKDTQINPEFKHIDGIRERVLGIAGGMDVDLTSTELKGLTQVVQDRLFKFPDQTVPADEAISDLKVLIQEDIRQVERSKQDITQTTESIDIKTKKKPKVSKKKTITSSIQSSPVTQSTISSNNVKAELKAIIDEEKADITNTTQEIVEEGTPVTPTLQEAKVESETATLPNQGAPRSSKKRVSVKRNRKTSDVLDVSDEGVLSLNKLNKKLKDSLPDSIRNLRGDLKVQIVNVTGKNLDVITETVGGRNFRLTIPSSKFNIAKPIPTEQDKVITQLELSDQIQDNRTPTFSPKKIISKAIPRPSISGTNSTNRLEQESKGLSEKLDKNKTTPEDIARLNEINTQLQIDSEDIVDTVSTVVSDEDIILEDKLAAIDKEIEIDRQTTSLKQLSTAELSQISLINSQITDLQDVLAVLDIDTELEERKNIQSQIRSLNQQKTSIRGFSLVENSNQRHIREKVINKDSDSTTDLPLDFQEVVITDSPDSSTIATHSKIRKLPIEPTPAILKDLNSMVDKVRSSLKRSIGDSIKIKVVGSYNEFVQARLEDGISTANIGTSEKFKLWRGLAAKNPDGSRTIFLNATQSDFSNIEVAAGTLMHELVGHIGLEKVFGNDFKNFKRSLLKSNPALRNDILKLSTRWQTYITNWQRTGSNNNIKLDDSNSFAFKNPSNDKITRIHFQVADRLSEEYLAELASIKMTDPTFKSSSSLREGFIRKIIKRLSHKMRSLLGKFNSGVNEEDLLASIAASADALFTDPDNFLFSELRPNVLNNELKKRSKGLGLDSRGRLRFNRNLEQGVLESDTETSTANQPLTKDEIDYLDSFDEIEVSMDPSDNEVGKNAAETMGANEAITEGVQRALNSNYGKLNESARVAWVNKVSRTIRSNPMASKFFALGNLPYAKLYNAVQAVTKGKLGKLENLSRLVNKQFKNLSAFQKAEVYNFFTTRLDEAQSNIAINELRGNGISEPVVRTILEAKGTIESLGQQLVDLNMLNPESFEENRGSYLPTRYLKYLFTNPGGGKKTSLLNFLKKDGNLDEDTKALLGEIKDPSFLVAETIGMIGRDVALLQMLDSISENGRTGATSWVLNSEDFVNFRGKNRSQAWLQAEIARVETILSDHLSDTSGAFQLNDNQLAFNRQALEDLQQAEVQAEKSILERMAKESEENGQGDIDPATYRAQHYTQMKKGRRLGKLSGLWVRKEIANDLEGVLQSFDIDPNDPIAQWFGNNGKLVKANSYWKMLKVPFNLPSWFRNGVGNLTLLDMSTNTNIGSLTKMFHEEVTGAISKKESKFWLMAVDNGLFGTTYAASELYGLRRDFDKRMKNAVGNQEIVKGSRVGGMFEFMNDQFLTASDFASRGFGYLEGSFKTVAMRDFIQQWEKQNNTQLDSLVGDNRQAVILEAVEHANNALFDYSQVPPLVNALRRYPLGAPFITFMYKSFPVVIESMAKRPQKFIKYAAFPMIMTTLAQAMNDWSDDDMDRLKGSLPQWTRDRSSVFLYPFKDSQGRPKFADYSYALPWSPFVDAGLKINNHFEAESISSAVNSTLALGQEIGDDLGFLGGPLSTVITAWKSNKDSFTGRTIVNQGDNPTKQFGDMTSWMWNMAMPSFLTSHGFLGKLYDDIGIDLPGIAPPQPLDSFGKEKSTFEQTLGSVTGFQSRSFTPADSIQSTLKGFDRRLREIDNSRRKFSKNPNLRDNFEERAAGLKEFNLRKKLILKERTEFFKRIRG